MKLLLLFCIIEVVSLGVVWYDVNGSKTDLEDRSKPKRTRRVPDKRGSMIHDSDMRTASVPISRKDTGLAGRSLEPN